MEKNEKRTRGCDIVIILVLVSCKAGFSVAIDDIGVGYSSLHKIAELRPAYLRYDMASVRDKINIL